MTDIYLDYSTYSRLYVKLTRKLVVSEDLKVYPTIASIMQHIEAIHDCKIVGIGTRLVRIEFNSSSAYTMFVLQYSEYLVPVTQST